MKKLLLSIALMLGVGISAYADYEYDLTATLSEGNYFFDEQEKFHYDVFRIYTDGDATVTFDNYDADLFSYQDEYDYNDPYLYLYSIENRMFDGTSGFAEVYTLQASDDDGNEELEDGLFFYLEDVEFSNELVAVITSYDPESLGTVDFKIYSDAELTVVPEPAAIGMVGLAGGLLLLARNR
jgi:hypothetical protein